MTRPWWAGAMRHSLASLLGCARAREHFVDLGFEDRAAEALVAQVGLRGELFSDDELRVLTLVTMTVDVLLEQQLDGRRGVTVVHLGGGLSTRRERFAGWPVRWIEVDEPAVAEMKRELLGRSGGDQTIACELGDTRWVDQLSGVAGKRLILVSEGGLLEAAPGDFHAVLDALAARLPTGTELVFAHDRRHPLVTGGAGSALALTRRGPDGEALLVRYPRLRLAAADVYDPDVAQALAGVRALHDLRGGRVPAVSHVVLS